MFRKNKAPNQKQKRIDVAMRDEGIICESISFLKHAFLLLLILVSAASLAQTTARLCAPKLEQHELHDGDKDRHATQFQEFFELGKELGFGEIHVDRLPAKRCRIDAKAGRYDMILASFSADDARDFDLPMKNGILDPGRRAFSINVCVAKRIGSTPTWDGRTFNGANAIGIRRGFPGITSNLEHYSINVNDAALSNEQLLKMLVQNRFDLAILYQEDFQQIQKKLQLSVEMIPPPLGKNDIYLAFSPKGRIANRELQEKWWKALQSLRDIDSGNEVEACNK